MEQTKLSPEQVLTISKGDTEIAAFIHSLLHTIEAQAALIETQASQIKKLEARVHELERQLDRNSRNSSKPPSSDGYRKPVNLRSKGGKKGAPKGHPGTTLEFVADPDHIVVHKLTTCADCGHSLADATHKGFERRQEVDIPLPRSRTTEHRAETGCCAHCGRKQVAAFPPHIQASTQYGLGFAAWAAYFYAYHMIPVKRIADLFEDMTTYRPSEATVLSLLQTSYEVLEPIETTIAEKLLQQVVVHADETGCRADGKLNWVHVCSDGGYTYLRVHEKRGEEAFKAIGFLPEYQGTVVHDCMKSYFKEVCAFSDALCNAHLLRESLGIAKHDGHRWASRMAELLREGWKAALAARAKEENVEPEVIQVFEDRYDAILREGEKEWALEEASTPVSKKGKQKKSKAGNLGERFMLHKEAILLFLRRPEIPFDNNQAERDLRMVKVKQKVSGAFRTQAGAVTFARLRSVISTLIKQKLPVLSSLTDAFRGTLVIPGT